MVLGVVMAGLAAYQLAHVLMLVFASVLVAVLLTALADGVERVTRLPRAAAMVNVPFWPLAAGLAFAALATIFRYGSRLQRDTDGLV